MNKISSPELLKTYEQIRGISDTICKQALYGIPKKDLLRVGATLGIVQGGTFVFNNESESSVLLDYCMHHDYTNGLKPLNRYLFAMKPKLSDAHLSVLNAMLDATFILFMIKETLPYGGVLVQDIVSEETFLLIDRNMSKIDKSVLDNYNPFILGATLIRFQEFTMTTGVGVLMTGPLADGIQPHLNTFIDKYEHFSLAPKEAQSKFVAQFLKVSISTNALEHSRYA